MDPMHGAIGELWSYKSSISTPWYPNDGICKGSGKSAAIEVWGAHFISEPHEWRPGACDLCSFNLDRRSISLDISKPPGMEACLWSECMDERNNFP